MNILFLNNAEISPHSNGIQRVTHLISQGLMKEHDIKCYSAFFHHNNASPKSEFYGKLKINKGKEIEQISEFISSNNIEVIICQEIICSERVLFAIRDAVNEAGNCKLIYCFHSAPNHIFTKPDFSAKYYNAIHKIELKKSIRQFLISMVPSFLYTYFVKRQTKKKYALINYIFDKIVLLSESYITPYCLLSGIPDIAHQTKVVAIPNPLTFSQHLLPEKLSDKKKEIIIVSRLSERAKRISLAFRIWKEIKRHNGLQNWKLTIVGTGEDERYYKMLSKKMNLQDISFEGRQDPTIYYKRASISIITSAYEGFPMNVLESLQMGVVPIIFDSFTSLHDFIEDKKNGIIVPNNNINQFVKDLAWIIQNEEKRDEIAIRGINDSYKFSIENITKLWMSLFKTLKN